MWYEFYKKIATSWNNNIFNLDESFRNLKGLFNLSTSYKELFSEPPIINNDQYLGLEDEGNKSTSIDMKDLKEQIDDQDGMEIDIDFMNVVKKNIDPNFINQE